MSEERERIYAIAEGGACKHSDERVGWLTNGGKKEFDADTREMLRRELWNSYRAGFLAAYDHSLIDRPIAVSDE